MRLPVMIGPIAGRIGGEIIDRRHDRATALVAIAIRGDRPAQAIDLISRCTHGVE